MANVTIYSTKTCPYCVQAKQLLDRKGISYTEIFVDEDDLMRTKMIELSGRRTVPQIFINEQAIGGCDDLYTLERSGELDRLLQS
ncbi:MAG: glutaredoxin 3 [Legionellales bacterium]|nr:glutaredoxin 3 [Legionellales bacterium]